MNLRTIALVAAALSATLVGMPCYAASKVQVTQYEKQVERAATKECSGDTGDGVSMTAYSGSLAGVGAVTVISALSNGCGGGQASRSWLWVFFADGSSGQASQPPNSIESLEFTGDHILVKSIEVGPEDSPNFPSHLTQFVYKVVDRKLTLASSKFLGIKKE
ncbi:hypothetical protein [Paraburkholderia caribensis]|uniref:hypothetical protein n=1 Tax=Paraburkholderia caribensis TaxID=75105 RepID=UPI00078DF6C9|nr:hypothetical protein [Paraburkholderia caribensis]AMV41749.1 hypothetical protein ATN79_03500 [Paraburkholderia caribensis]